MLTRDDAMGTSATVTGKRGRPPAGMVEALNGPTDPQDMVDIAGALMPCVLQIRK